MFDLYYLHCCEPLCRSLTTYILTHESVFKYVFLKCGHMKPFYFSHVRFFALRNLYNFPLQILAKSNIFGYTFYSLQLNPSFTHLYVPLFVWDFFLRYLPSKALIKIMMLAKTTALKWTNVNCERLNFGFCKMLRFFADNLLVAAASKVVVVSLRAADGGEQIGREKRKKKYREKYELWKKQRKNKM